MRETKQDVVPLGQCHNARAETQGVAMLSVWPVPSVCRLNNGGCTTERFESTRFYMSLQCACELCPCLEHQNGVRGVLRHKSTNNQGTPA